MEISIKKLVCSQYGCSGKGYSSPTGGSTIIRDDGGNFISAITANFGHCSAFKDDYLALARGLDLADELQITKLEIQLDHLACVQTLYNNELGRNGCAHII